MKTSDPSPEPSSSQHAGELARLLPELIGWLREHGYEPLLDLEGGRYTSAAPAIDRALMPAQAPGLGGA